MKVRAKVISAVVFLQLSNANRGEFKCRCLIVLIDWGEGTGLSVDINPHLWPLVPNFSHCVSQSSQWRKALSCSRQVWVQWEGLSRVTPCCNLWTRMSVGWVWHSSCIQLCRKGPTIWCSKNEDNNEEAIQHMLPTVRGCIMPHVHHLDLWQHMFSLFISGIICFMLHNRHTCSPVY